MNKAKIGIAALVLSALGFVGIISQEGYTTTPVIPVKGDVPTIGFGTTGGVKLTDRTDPVTAMQRAMRDMATYEGAVKRCVVVPLTQSEYDSFVSFAYNVGGANFCGSTLVKKVNKGDHVGACAELGKWVLVKGVRVQGLVNRRAQEMKMCLSDLT